MNQPLFDLIAPPVTKRRAITSQPVSPSRKSDPDTAKEAANANREIRKIQRQVVYEYLQSVGSHAANDYEIERDTGILRTSAGKRRLELMRIGLAEYAGFKRPTDTGSPGRCHRVVK